MDKGFQNDKDRNWHKRFIISLVKWNTFSCPNFPFVLLDYLHKNFLKRKKKLFIRRVGFENIILYTARINLGVFCS